MDYSLPLWLPIFPLIFEFSVILSLSWLLACLLCSIKAAKNGHVAAAGFFLGALSPPLFLLSTIWQQASGLFCAASDLIWGPALACLAWSGLGIWPGMEKYHSLSFLPLVAMLLYLLRLVILPLPGKEAIAIYGPLMSLPLILTWLKRVKGGFALGMGAVLLALGWGTAYWYSKLIAAPPSEMEWLNLLIPAGGLLVAFGFISYHKSSDLS